MRNYYAQYHPRGSKDQKLANALGIACKAPGYETEADGGYQAWIFAPGGKTYALLTSREELKLIFPGKQAR